MASCKLSSLVNALCVMAVWMRFIRAICNARGRRQSLSRMRSGWTCACQKACVSAFTARSRVTTATRSTKSFTPSIEWQTRDPGFSPPGDGESQRVFYHRVVYAMEPIIAAYAGGRIAVVVHSGVLDCIYRLAMKLSLQEPRAWPLLNCSVNVVGLRKRQRSESGVVGRCLASRHRHG